VVQELWFIVVMAGIALLLLAIVLGVMLHKFDTVPDTTGFSNSVTLKGFTMKIEELVEAKCEPTDEDPPQGELGILSVNSLRRSVSQVMDGKSLTGDDEAWDPNISGHDSGMFMDDEEFVDTIKGFSTVKKEHTMFTDTNL
uniref:Si:ch211-57i17.5 n=1 Tax=Seriola dumerili TaxID=41447 RepID=A0A3B4UCI7_SERDU